MCGRTPAAARTLNARGAHAAAQLTMKLSNGPRASVASSFAAYRYVWAATVMGDGPS